MKARQIAVSPDSVYALGPSDEVMSIERGADGLWGSWSDAGATGRSLVHDGPVIGRIGLDDRVSVLQRKPPLPWTTWDLEARELAAARLPDGAPALFAVGLDATVWHTWKPTPTAPWADWQSLDGSLAGITANLIPGGGLAVFGIGDGTVYHRWQDAPVGPWHGWTGLDAPPGGASALGATTIFHGGLVVFALGGDGGVYHRWQDKPFGAWHDWDSLGGGVRSFSIARSASGGLAVFAVGTDDGVKYRYQVKPFGEWSRWIDLQGRAKSVAAQRGYLDGLEVFAVGPDDEVYHKWCDRLDLPWTDWMLLDHESSPFRLARDAPRGSR